MGYGSFGSAFSYGGGGFTSYGRGGGGYGGGDNEEFNVKRFIIVLLIAIATVFLTFKCTFGSSNDAPDTTTYVCKDTTLLVHVNDIRTCAYGIRSFSAYYDSTWIYCADVGSGYYYKRYSIKTGDTLRLNVHLVKVYDTCEVHHIRFLTEIYAKYNFNRFHTN